MDPTTVDTAAKVAVGASGGSGILWFFARKWANRVETAAFDAHALAISAATMDEVREEIDRSTNRPIARIEEELRYLRGQLDEQSKMIARIANRG